MVYIYTCNCLLEHLLKMSYYEIEASVSNFDIFAINNNIHILFNGEKLHFFCSNVAYFITKLQKYDGFCLRRSDVYDDNCIDHFDKTGVICFCIHCNIIFSKSIEGFLTKIKK